MTEPTSLAARAQKRYGPPENIELRYDGPFGTGDHRFSGWCVGFEWVTKYLAQELSDDEAACVAFFVTVENEVIVVYDLGPRNEFPDNRDSPSPDSVVQQFLTGCYRGKVSWLALCGDFGEAFSLAIDRGAVEVAVYRATNPAHWFF